MLHKQQLVQAILTVTLTIQKDFPELYEHLNETPLLFSYGRKEIGIADYEQYLESLTMQMAVFTRPNHNKVMAV